VMPMGLPVTRVAAVEPVPADEVTAGRTSG
jgi:hypothetical protein